ncbi:MAG TPA: hypothetical protein VGP93_00105 [Polyangiaceae bacterium]|nr:hypothetical protein [Polyangiaceae bacterium]
MHSAAFPHRPLGRRALFGSLLGLVASMALAIEAEPALAVEHAQKPHGRPRVTLDRLVFPPDIGSGAELERHLKQVLRREARRADWGAGAGAKIEIRFIVEELEIKLDDKVLRVRCTALGRLPKGRSARSHLDYGGSPAKRNDEVKKVLGIVARGVMTRLAELERQRRLGR